MGDADDPETTLISDEDATNYRGILEEIYKRIVLARTRLPHAQYRPDYEACALQVRVAIELIVMGSLITNRTAIEETGAAIVNARKASDAAKLAKNANRDYWPKGTTVVKVEGKVDEMVHLNGALKEEDWPREWGKLSALLHARNPLKEPPHLRDAAELIHRLIRAVELLIAHHNIVLADREGMLVCQVGDWGTSVTPFVTRR